MFLSPLSRLDCKPYNQAMPRISSLLLVLAAVTLVDAADRRALEEFEKHVRPLLIRRCYSCHSAQSRPLRGALRLDTRAGWRTGGERGPAVIPGRPDQSLLVKAVRYRDEALQMPPKQKLSKSEIAILVRWVHRSRLPKTTTGQARRWTASFSHG